MVSIMSDEFKKVYNEFLKLGYSEKDALNLARLAFDTVTVYSGYVDIDEVSDSLIEMFNKNNIRIK